VKRAALVLNRAMLFVCISMYLGTGWSLILFSFPVASQLTIETYYLQFVPQVTAATHFFTFMTIVLIVAAIVMVVEQWRGPERWVPIVVLLAVVAATLLTTSVILPLNEEMRNGIRDVERLRAVLTRWMDLNRLRVVFWTVQWIAMMSFYVARELRTAPRGPAT
jgi:hypothetical protein